MNRKFLKPIFLYNNVNKNIFQSVCVYCGNIYKDHSSELPNASDILRAGVIGTNQDLANYLSTGFWDDFGDNTEKI